MAASLGVWGGVCGGFGVVKHKSIVIVKTSDNITPTFFNLVGHLTSFCIEERCCVVKYMQHQSTTRCLGSYLTNVITQHIQKLWIRPVQKNGCVA